MIKRFGNGYAALVIMCAALLAVIAFIAWTIPYSKGYQAADQDHQSAYTEHNSAQEYYVECARRPSVEEALECYQEAENRTREQQASEQDLDAQREMANWAEGMLWATVFVGCATILVTALGVYWVRETLVATRGAVKAAEDAVAVTRNIGEVQASAYFDIQHLALIQNSGRPTIEIKFFNSGQTPAYNVTLEVAFIWGENRNSRYFSVFQTERIFYNIVAPSQPKDGFPQIASQAFQAWFDSSPFKEGLVFVRIDFLFSNAFRQGKSSTLHYWCKVWKCSEFDIRFDFISDPQPPYYR